jgi:SAM-dependent methyltransferase
MRRAGHVRVSARSEFGTPDRSPIAGDQGCSMEHLTVGYTGADNLAVMAVAQNYNRSLVELVAANLPRAGTVLDFGAGIGTLDDALGQEGYTVQCLEVDAGLAQVLESKGYTVWQSLDAIRPSSVSHVFSFNVLEHIEDDAAAIRDLLPVLAPRGRVLMYVPAFQVLFSSMDRKVGHFRRYRKESLAKLFESNGYRVRSARYADCAGFAAALVYRLIGNRDGDIDNRSVRFFDRWIFPLNRMLDPLFRHWFGKNLVIVAERA